MTSLLPGLLSRLHPTVREGKQESQLYPRPPHIRTAGCQHHVQTSAAELSWSLVKTVIGGKTNDRLSQEERELRALRPLVQTEEAARSTCYTSKLSSLLHADQCMGGGSPQSSAFSVTSAWHVHVPEPLASAG